MQTTDAVFIFDLGLKGLQIITLIGGGAYVVFKLGRVTERVENMLATQTKELTELKEETKKVGTILTTLAVQEQRLDLLDARYEELRHGEGFVFPLQPFGKS